jgi:predicted nuclease of restriction endonuclease-like (RecB) superfamily
MSADIEKSDSSALEQPVQQLYGNIAQLIKEAKNRVAVSANSEITLLNWRVGVFINQFVLQGNRASYGKQIVVNLSVLLIENFGSGWSEKQLLHCLRVAESFSENQIVSALRRQLSWTHLKTIAYEKDGLKRQFYLEMAINQRWNTRPLAEQMDKMLFERTAIAQKPDEQIREALGSLNDENLINPDLFFKNTYVLDFLQLQNTFSENDLEQALVNNLQQFILELGNGFAFLERQKRISIDAIDYHLDLLFYHRKLKWLIAIDLKLGKFKPEHKAQMELYLRYLKKHDMQAGEETPIGLLLCSEGNTEHIELLMLDETDVKVAQYLTELPSKQWFADKLHQSVEIAKMNAN